MAIWKLGTDLRHVKYNHTSEQRSASRIRAFDEMHAINSTL